MICEYVRVTGAHEAVLDYSENSTWRRRPRIRHQMGRSFVVDKKGIKTAREWTQEL